jgi:poly-beta-1,6-N-acetyl-D-glucosamine synthase
VTDAPLSYALITPARNEGKYIRRTLESMMAQTVPPVRWVIVSDASTDDTDAIVAEYQERAPWIELVRREATETRQFGAKVRAFNAGWERLADVEYDLIGNLDADLEFPPEYFAFLLEKFRELPDHGLIGTPYVDVGTAFQKSKASDRKHVPGACQLFRRECFEAIGGYTPLPTGGMDLVAELRCRQLGWKTRSFEDYLLTHLRPIGTATRGLLASRFNYGNRDYYFGVDPIWQLVRVVNQMRHRPYLIGGLYILAGYIWGHITRHPSPVPADLRAFRRREQRQRLLQIFTGKPGD